VVCGELLLPGGDVWPLLVAVGRFLGLVEGVGVVQLTAAAPRAGEDHDVAQQVDALDAVAADRARPEELLEVPGVLSEILIRVALAGLEDTDLVSLLNEAQGGDGTAEARADDEDVIVGCGHG